MSGELALSVGGDTDIGRLNTCSLACRNDPKTVAIVALACNHPNTKVQSAAIHFFLGSENEGEDSSDEEEEVCPKRYAFLPSTSLTFFLSSSTGP